MYDAHHMLACIHVPATVPTPTDASSATVDDQNPALPLKRNIPEFPKLRVLKVMQDLDKILNPKPKPLKP